jgi:hypothetical protein
MGESGSVIDFDRAEYGANKPSAAPCANCKKPIEDQYWNFRNSAVCGTCRSAIEGLVAKSTSTASLGNAALRGGGVALACGVAYAVFVAVSHIQLALVTIGIAFVIAKVVRKASGGIGGRRFQILAVALTYLASAMGYLPPVVRSAFDQEPAHRHSAPSADAPAGGASGDVEQAPKAAPRLSGLAQAVALVKLVAIVLGIALAAPFLEATEAPLGLLIVAFGLWEAWKLTKEVPVVFDGPYRIGQGAGTASPP